MIEMMQLEDTSFETANVDFLKDLTESLNTIRLMNTEMKIIKLFNINEGKSIEK